MEALIRGISGSDLKFLGDDSGCSVDSRSERDRTACRGSGQAVVVGAGNNWREAGGGCWTDGI